MASLSWRVWVLLGPWITSGHTFIVTTVVYTDHEALKSLLNTPQPSGNGVSHSKRWTSRFVTELENRTLMQTLEKSNWCWWRVATHLSSDCSSATRVWCKGRGTDQSHPFRETAADLREIIIYLETGDLPSDQKRTRELALTKCQYVLVDNVLYYVVKDKSLRVVPPKASREKLLREAHDGVFGGHLKANNIVGELGKHYWWPGMSRDN